MVELTWRKSTHSGSGDQCVEVAALPEGGRAIRDSKNPDGPMLMINRSEFTKFVQGLHG
ncbi:DUF397 domain-containing protein [Actinocorallia longicatena]|uniref:DUF397 domain-containing protein n=1 Tax=Actinocorallia longicatena TaxID=111803 RepID=A0ABP6QGW9_9ACTN